MATIKKLVADVYQLSLFPFSSINAYLADGVLIDAGVRWNRKQILRLLKGFEVTAHALTHAHGDHQGSSHFICEELDIPFWVGRADAEAAVSGRIVDTYSNPGHWFSRFQDKFWVGPGHPVDRELKEGDRVGNFEVIETPGHSKGHISFWRKKDRVLIVGDVLMSANPFTMIPGLQLPLEIFTPDMEVNIASAKKLAALEPELICFGHGPPIRDTRQFVEFCESL